MGRRSCRAFIDLSLLDGIVEYRGMDADGAECDGVFIPYERNDVGRGVHGERYIEMSGFGTPVYRKYDLFVRSLSGGRDGRRIGTLYYDGR